MEDRDFQELQAHIERLEAELAELKRGPAVRLRGLLAHLPSSRQARVALVAGVLVVATASYAATISMPYTFANGTTADADEVNANFSTLVTESNDQDSRIATIETDTANHAADPSAHHTKYTDPEAVAAILAADGSGSGLDADLLDGLDSSAFATTGDSYTKAEVDALLASINAAIAANTTAIATLNTTFSGVSRGGTPDTLTFSGMNVQVVDGSGDTGYTVNGLGNLIVGYNENNYSATRTGSHNLVVGYDHEYTSYGGLVAGHANTISGISSTVSGGDYNTASGGTSSVSGGDYNTASGSTSGVSGGRSNEASGSHSSVTGGHGNEASSEYSSVSGGQNNVAMYWYTSVTGGAHNTANVIHASVSGGNYNTASGAYSSVSGGNYNTASGYNASVSGGMSNEASAYSSSVSGGRNNSAGGDYSVVIGGNGNSTSTTDDIVP